MFAFRNKGALSSHAGDAVVSAHVVRGRVAMRTGERAFDLDEGEMVRMQPRTVHEVRAVIPSAPLLHGSIVPV